MRFVVDTLGLVIGVPGSSDNLDSLSSAAIRVFESGDSVAERHCATSDVILRVYECERKRETKGCWKLDSKVQFVQRPRLLRTRVLAPCDKRPVMA